MQHTTTHCNKLQHNATHITHSPTEARRKVFQYQSLFNLSLFTGICLFSQEFVSFHRNMSLFTGLCHFAQNHVSLDRKGGQRNHVLKRLYTRLEICLFSHYYVSFHKNMSLCTDICLFWHKGGAAQSRFKEALHSTRNIFHDSLWENTFYRKTFLLTGNGSSQVVFWRDFIPDCNFLV